MQKIALTALSATIIATGMASLYAESNYYEPTKESIVAKQQASSAMRMQYYDKYIAKGYDVTSIKAYLDPTTTTEEQFWQALRDLQNTHEMSGRKAYVEKLSSKGYDVSGFTEAVMWDSGKFWEMVKMVEAGKKSVTEVKKEEYKKPDEKKAEFIQKVEEKKTQVAVKVSAVQEERLRAMMQARIAKLPADTRDATLSRLETALVKGIETARTKNAKLLVARYEILLSVVREEMGDVDDETLVDALFQ